VETSRGGGGESGREVEKRYPVAGENQFLLKLKFSAKFLTER